LILTLFILVCFKINHLWNYINLWFNFPFNLLSFYYISRRILILF